ncbi:MAG TPA: glutamyl-tRNA reductase [Desulfobacteraceae bacterium]|nr:glutamyl-tRNA reductase [Desulfobacteraceae bacterium]
MKAQIVNIGMNHETAPVELRECIAADAGGTRKILDALRESPCVKEGLFLSTCNRVEILFTSEEVEDAKKEIIALLSDLGQVKDSAVSDCFYSLEGLEAVKHIFRVASSLDSMVVGEPQILGQIKQAYQLATQEKTSGVIVNRLMHRAFHVAKRVRTETGICESAVSISYAAVELAKKIFHSLEGKEVLLIGAGEMAELAARHLVNNGVSSMMVANRTFERAVEVAENFDAKPVSFEEIDRELLKVDIVVCSTGSREPVIYFEQVKKSLRKRRNRPLFFIDIAVPRDVESRVNDLANVYLYDIDDLKGVIALNVEQRKKEAVRAERIVQEEVLKFGHWLNTLSVVPTIVELRKKADAIIQAELKKSSSLMEHLTDGQREDVEVLARSIAEKVLNDPILFLKGRAERATVDTYLDIARRLFNLDRNHGVKYGSKSDDT